MIPVIERILQKISVTDSDCWEWQGSLSTYGYGIIIIDYKQIRVHRFIYEYYHGQICPDLVIDHLCRNKKCSNPIHLEQVTNRINIQRGNAGRHGKHSKGNNHYQNKKTHCKNGHEFTPENTAIRKDNSRSCKLCHKTRQKILYYNNK